MYNIVFSIFGVLKVIKDMVRFGLVKKLNMFILNNLRIVINYYFIIED